MSSQALEPKPTAVDADPLDTAGQAILGVIQRAAGIAEARGQQMRDVIAQLHAAEDRIRQLEQDVRYYQDRAERAESWLFQISAEIERGFFGPDDVRGRPPTQQTAPRPLGRSARPPG